MKKHKEELYTDPWERDWYETGSTRPPKDRGGIIAVLLMLVIILGSITTALGIMNVRLFRMLTDQQASTVYLSKAENETVSNVDFEPENNQTQIATRLGIEGQTVSKFDRRFYQLPQGFLVLEVAEDCFAHRAGLRAGDVIVSIDGTAICSGDELNAAVQKLKPGQQVYLRVYRQQLDKELSITIETTSEE